MGTIISTIRGSAEKDRAGTVRRKRYSEKKIILGFTFFAVLIVAALYVTSKISDAYKTANRKILNDPTIGQEYGMQQYTVLVGSSFKLGPEWSCASLVFFVKGANSGGFVNVKLRRKKIYRDAWDVLDLTSGFYTRSEVSCGPTA